MKYLLKYDNYNNYDNSSTLVKTVLDGPTSNSHVFYGNKLCP